MTIGIYKITNKKTGQIYIGQSINIEKRFKEHIRGKDCPSSYIDNALQKYGKENFNFEIIEKFDKDISFLNDVLNNREIYYIAAYNTFNDDFHYNLTIGGDGVGFGENHPNYGNPNNYHHSEEIKKKISEAQKGKYTGENNPNYGKKLSEETRKKLSEAKSGENNPMYGKHHSEEAKKKMSDAHIKKYARIIKRGKSNNKQVYAIRYQEKNIKFSFSIDKLKKWFSNNYPNETLVCNF